MTYTEEQRQAAAEAMGFENMELCLYHYLKAVMDAGLYEALLEKSKGV
jgi:hypothetical protein